MSGDGQSDDGDYGDQMQQHPHQMHVIHSRIPQHQKAGASKEKVKLPKPETVEACPRCGSADTKFCYYNNYNPNQPRYFCKSCQRYWTAGGTLRNVPPGSGRRKSKSANSRDYDQKPMSADQLVKQPAAAAAAAAQSLLAANPAASLAAANPFLNPLLGADSSALLAYNAAAQQQLLGQAALNAALTGKLAGFQGQWPSGLGALAGAAGGIPGLDAATAAAAAAAGNPLAGANPANGGLGGANPLAGGLVGNPLLASNPLASIAALAAVQHAASLNAAAAAAAGGSSAGAATGQGSGPAGSPGGGSSGEDSGTEAKEPSHHAAKRARMENGHGVATKVEPGQDDSNVDGMHNHHHRQHHRHQQQADHHHQHQSKVTPEPDQHQHPNGHVSQNAGNANGVSNGPNGQEDSTSGVPAVTINGHVSKQEAGTTSSANPTSTSSGGAGNVLGGSASNPLITPLTGSWPNLDALLGSNNDAAQSLGGHNNQGGVKSPLSHSNIANNNPANAASAAAAAQSAAAAAVLQQQQQLAAYQQMVHAQLLQQQALQAQLAQAHAAAGLGQAHPYLQQLQQLAAFTNPYYASLASQALNPAAAAAAAGSLQSWAALAAANQSAHLGGGVAQTASGNATAAPGSTGAPGNAATSSAAAAAAANAWAHAQSDPIAALFSSQGLLDHGGADANGQTSGQSGK